MAILMFVGRQAQTILITYSEISISENRPEDLHYHCRYAGHAEPKHHTRENELVGSLVVQLKDGHMGDGSDKKEE